MRYGILITCFVVLPLGSLHAQSEATIEGVRTSVEKWVETRQITARLQAEWRSEKEMLDQTKTLYEKEFAGLEEKLVKSDASTSQVSEEYKKLQVENQELEDATARVAEWVTRFEQTTRALARTLPSPLLSKLEPLMKRIPEDPAKSRLNPVERMQNLVGILIEVDKFNNSIAVESELQKRPSGEEIQVRTIYLGLAQAYFVDKTGEFAGVGIPTQSGWNWAELPGLGGHILRAIAIYENTQPPSFVELPLTLN